jgi:hypothetical protein
MEKLFWTRWDWAIWTWHHPWFIAVNIAVIGAVFLLTKLHDR